MPKVTPFKAIRPNSKVAPRVAALPYDVYNRKEAKAEVLREPLSFLQIDRAETLLDDSVDTYDPCVYAMASKVLNDKIKDGTFIIEETPSYYLYELTMDGRSQTGFVACSSIDDYVSGAIKKHENTREEKELDRISHVDITNTHTGPIFLIYKTDNQLQEIMDRVKLTTPLNDFVSPDGIGHKTWIISDSSTVEAIEKAFDAIPCTYIADGHHRCASAVKVGLRRREKNPDYTGEEEYNRFLSVLFPEDQLYIMPYNRVVKDLNGLSKSDFLEKIQAAGFQTEEKGTSPYSPCQKGTFGMYLDGIWYELKAKDSLFSTDPVKGLDVSILQDYLLEPVLGISDPRVDSRIDFVGGIRGLGELERRAKEDMKIAFSMYPTSIEELLSVADAGLLMPPKSTWFEPKLRSGLFLHSLS